MDKSFSVKSLMDDFYQEAVNRGHISNKNVVWTRIEHRPYSFDPNQGGSDTWARVEIKYIVHSNEFGQLILTQKVLFDGKDALWTREEWIYGIDEPAELDSEIKRHIRAQANAKGHFYHLKSDAAPIIEGAPLNSYMGARQFLQIELRNRDNVGRNYNVAELSLLLYQDDDRPIEDIEDLIMTPEFHLDDALVPRVFDIFELKEPLPALHETIRGLYETSNGVPAPHPVTESVS